MIFTSGSTGTPRGVIVTHRSVVNHNLAAAALFGLGPGDRVLQFSPLHFDLAVEEIFPTWISGATLVLREKDDVLDPRRFTDWIEQERITVLDLPTAYWHTWVDWLSQRARVPAGRCRVVVVGGEKALSSTVCRLAKSGRGPRSLAEHLRSHRGDRDRHRLRATGPGSGSRRDTHRPTDRGSEPFMSWTRDPQPVPIGQPGELYIGGTGVSRGYLGCPASTAERFLPDPFASVPGARLFRTGDLVRSAAPTASSLFLGRT